MRQERVHRSFNGYVMALIGFALIGCAVWWLSQQPYPGPLVLLRTVGLIVLGALTLAGLYMLQPNEGAILTLFGKYIGTDRGEGLRWATPFYGRRKISLRARNLIAPPLKVNDKRGNPIVSNLLVVLCSDRET